MNPENKFNNPIDQARANYINGGLGAVGVEILNYSGKILQELGYQPWISWTMGVASAGAAAFAAWGIYQVKKVENLSQAQISLQYPNQEITTEIESGLIYSQQFYRNNVFSAVINVASLELMFIGLHTRNWGLAISGAIPNAVSLISTLYTLGSKVSKTMPKFWTADQKSKFDLSSKKPEEVKTNRRRFLKQK